MTYCYRDAAKGIHATWEWIGFGVELEIVAVLFLVTAGNAALSN